MTAGCCMTWQMVQFVRIFSKMEHTKAGGSYIDWKESDWNFPHYGAATTLAMIFGKAEHKCTCGWLGSVPVGLNNIRIQTQICAGHQIQVTWIHRSSAHQNAGTCLRSGSCRYLKILTSIWNYGYVILQRNSRNVYFIRSGPFGDCVVLYWGIIFY